ncbi:hypothetical protein [Photobacterium damselae]|uniref:hypothetical protein n=1 Tax=Photobacterium damselae TaxID=38293 RepID=UPI001F35FD2F|nr:hypothetical protein [Photobacterium damselae]UKA04844.1 hypothetical protein IHC89_21615 [Photobacterium damselae subsp. damselae]
MSNKDLLIYSEVMKHAYAITSVGVLTLGIGNVFGSYYCEKQSSDIEKRQTVNSSLVAKILGSMNDLNMKFAKLSLAAMCTLLLALTFQNQFCQILESIIVVSYTVLSSLMAVRLLLMRRVWSGILSTTKERLGIGNKK